MAAESSRSALVILSVEDLARSRAFYAAAFGWTERVAESVYAEFELPDGLRLGLYERPAFGSNIGQTPYQVPTGAIASTELYFVAVDLDADIT